MFTCETERFELVVNSVSHPRTEALIAASGIRHLGRRRARLALNLKCQLVAENVDLEFPVRTAADS